MTIVKKKYHILPEHYEKCLDAHGATPQGVDWPNANDLITRLNVMLGLFQHDQIPTKLLDLGCGYGALIDHLHTLKLSDRITYTGIDISEKMVKTAKKLHPNADILCVDILQQRLPINSFDYIIMNGLLTEKRSLTWQEMKDFACAIILEAFRIAKKGIAFNVMSNQVDWCRTDLFHWSFDDLTHFLSNNCSRHITLRADYGLYEYTVYVYKTPRVIHYEQA